MAIIQVNCRFCNQTEHERKHGTGAAGFQRLVALKVRNLNDFLPERSRHNSRQNELLTDLTSAIEYKHGFLLNTFMLFSEF